MLFKTDYENLSKIPLPHLVPKDNKTAVFKFSMINDLIYDRNLQHSDEYYINNIRKLLISLNQNLNKEKQSILFDEISENYKKISKYDESINYLQKKLNIENNISKKNIDYFKLGLLYSEKITAKPISKNDNKNINQSLKYLRLAIPDKNNIKLDLVKWQYQNIIYLKSGIDNNENFYKYDLFANNLRSKISDYKIYDSDRNTYYKEIKQPYNNDIWVKKSDYKIDNAFVLQKIIKQNKIIDLSQDRLDYYRKFITTIGDNDNQIKDGIIIFPIPFDEAMINIMKMSNDINKIPPYFLLSIAETMTHIGKNKIAWNAYEKAISLSENFWANNITKSKFVQHCANRQNELETILKISKNDLRNQFNKHSNTVKKIKNEYISQEKEKLKTSQYIDYNNFNKEFINKMNYIESDKNDDFIF